MKGNQQNENTSCSGEKAKLTYSLANRIFVITFMPFVTAMFGLLFFVFLKRGNIFDALLIFLPLTLLMAPLSVCWIIVALKAEITFDDEKLTIKSGFSTKTIAVRDIVSFLARTDVISITYKKRTDSGEKIRRFVVSQFYKNREMLEEWLSERVENSFVTSANKEFEEFKESEMEKGLSEDEQTNLLLKAHKAARIIEITGIVVALLFFASNFLAFFCPSSLTSLLNKVTFVVCAVYPLLLFPVLRFSGGMLRFEAGTGVVYPSLMPGFVYASISLFLEAHSYFDSLLHLTDTVFIPLLFTAALTFFYLICASDSEKKGVTGAAAKLLYILGIMLVFFFYSLSVSIFVNIRFDCSEPEVSEATVLEMEREYRGKRYHYELTVSPWIDGKLNEKEIEVSKSLYSRTQKGDSVVLGLYKGRLGIPWFVCAKK